MANLEYDMAVKFLISGLAGAGKTTLLKPLKNALVISHDGKSFDLPIPHAYVKSFSSVDELINITAEKVKAYHEKFKKYPETLVFDSVSKIFDTISNNCNRKFTGFTIYSEVNKEINTFNTFLENDVVSEGINLVILSHATYDSEAESFKLVAQGKFAERGGYYAEVNESAFIHAKGSKRTVYLRSVKYPARTLQESLPESLDSSEFNLQTHIETLANLHTDISSYAL